MARYLIQSTHTPSECLEALDEVLAQAPEILTSLDFGCAVGDHSNHTSFFTVEADSPDAARGHLPERLSDKATVIEVGKFTPEQIKSFHRGL